MSQMLNQKTFLKMARYMVAPQSFLFRLEGSDEYGIMVRRNKWKKPVLKLSESVVESFVKNDLLSMSKKREGFIILSEPGHKCYHRLINSGGFLAQHQEMDIAANGTMYNVVGSPIDLLRRHNNQGRLFFNETELAAAERLYRDYEISLALNGMTTDLSRQGIRSKGSQSYDLPDRVLDASRRVEKALEHIGSDLNDILRLICLDMVGLERAEKKLGWPRRSGKLVLKIALNRLQKFYAGVEM